MKLKPIGFFLGLICIFYLWYFLPSVNALFEGAKNNITFFSLFVIGAVGILVIKSGKIRINPMICLVALYCAVVAIMAILGLGDAHKHVRISLTFYTTVLLYFILLNYEQRIKLGKFLIVLFFVTCVTSGIAVMLDNSVSRTLTHAAADDELQRSLRLMNIGDIYLFQSLVMCVPAIYALLKKRPVIRLILLIVMGIVLINASYSISLMLFVFAIIMAYRTRLSTFARLTFTAVSIVLLLLLYFVGFDLLTILANAIDNARVAYSILDVRNLLYGMDATAGTLSMRMQLYAASWNTFIQNPFGTGPHYSYIAFQNGIGYHSQILDDLARYGIFALILYSVFFVEYYRWLKREWSKIDEPAVASVTTLLYVLFLILNIGMRSGIESAVMFLIIPIVPEMLLAKSPRIAERNN